MLDWVKNMKPLLLITNDDGVFSPGIRAVVEAVQDLGDLLIVAPLHQQTCMSRAMPKGIDAGIIESVSLKVNDEEVKAFAVHGSPTQAVMHALLEISPFRKPDLCISGINYGENVGANITMSGTLGAAFEANSSGIRSLAISLETPIDSQWDDEYALIDWHAAIYFTRYFAMEVLNKGLPPEVAILNVNVPSDAQEFTPIRYTNQSRQSYFRYRGSPQRDFSAPFRFIVEIRIDEETLERKSDIKALRDRCVSVTPLGWDFTAKIDLGYWLKHSSGKR